MHLIQILFFKFFQFYFEGRRFLYRGLGISQNLGIYIPGDWEFCIEIFIPGIGDFFKYRDLYPRHLNPKGLGIFEIWKFFLNVGIYIPGILFPRDREFSKSGDFFKCGDLYPRDFNPQALGIFEIWGFYPRDWGFLCLGIGDF